MIHQNAKRTAKRNKEILALAKNGVSYRQIALKFGISFQRVAQIWRKAHPLPKIDFTRE